jgi:hypothetical protein
MPYRIIQLYNGYSAYLLIVDGASRRVWVFLMESKSSSIKIVKGFLQKFGLGNGVIRTDQSGELARCDAFHTTVMDDCSYTVEPMGADSPSQNDGAEIYNGTLAVKVRTLLYGSGLPPSEVLVGGATPLRLPPQPPCALGGWYNTLRSLVW